MHHGTLPEEDVHRNSAFRGEPRVGGSSVLRTAACTPPLYRHISTVKFCISLK